MGQWVEHLLCKHEDPQNPCKSWARVMCVGNLSTPAVKGKAETGESVEVCRPPSLVYAAANRDRLRVEGED